MRVCGCFEEGTGGVGLVNVGVIAWGLEWEIVDLPVVHRLRCFGDPRSAIQMVHEIWFWYHMSRWVFGFGIVCN